MEHLQQMPDAKANRTKVIILVAFCLLCTVLSVGVLFVDLLMPPPWGGMVDRHPWTVAGMMLFVNSLSLLLLVSWLVHFFPWRLSVQKLAIMARTTARDFHYWTVGDLKERA